MCIVPLDENWKVEDYDDTKGITKALFDSSSKSLIISATLKGKDPNISKGEVYLDLRWVESLCLDNKRNKKNEDFINLNSETLVVEIYIPNGFIGSQSAPNGIQLFAKSGENFLAAYSEWENIEEAGKTTFEFNLTDGPFDYKKRGYDSKLIASIGVKFAINNSSRRSFNGDFAITYVGLK